jgi:soluble lytic murein transglycosylase-like protein
MVRSGSGGVRVAFRVKQSIGMAVTALAALALCGCASTSFPNPHLALAAARSNQALSVGPINPGGLDGLIAKYAALYHVPEGLIRRIIVRESGYNPRAHNGPYWGLMQIRYDTAESMGYRGPASGLLDAETNLRYGVKYLSGAYVVGEQDADQAVRNYASGYYYMARAKGLLADVGLD